ncbi:MULTISPECIES: polymer-forming cytoskeletal protein [unclassified Paenibacillus]|uniref:bactofilin family protein n=1 Tax=unclassified Paenibacillus TaxID=185978 RepID=UPI001042DA40|nr:MULTISPECIES: polymer-forming cytoskeletal protein [unclassified Paenibacillus]NIK70307.1 cytoskeletal protein CcmA (bactofilin family) [Paenibacillus sp. BK720]TCM90768.1 cytoskeletal protein CcmA (bactofilin family) [Paenibacillus sp. BK033]
MFKDNKRVSATDTLIGLGTHIEGKLVCEANLRIEGEHSGDIECLGDVIIGENGMARSNITARDITIAGKVYGEVTAKGRLTITATGQLTGSLSAQGIIVQDGGMLNGTCHMERQTERTRPLSEPAKEQSREKEKARQAV